MSVDFTGFRVKKPRIAGSNNIATSETDVYVPVANNAAFEAVWDPNSVATTRAEYLILTEAKGRLPQAALAWCRNDQYRTRFGWAGAFSRWEPYPGTKPYALVADASTLQGATADIPLVPAPNYTLLAASVASVRVTVGPTTLTLTVDPDLSTIDATVPATGNAIIFQGDNVLRINTLDASAIPVWWFNNKFATNNTGIIGGVADVLYANPIPLAENATPDLSWVEEPAIHIGSGPALIRATATPVASGFFYLDYTTGLITLNAADITNNAAKNVYYRGVLNRKNVPCSPITAGVPSGSGEVSSPFSTTPHSPYDAARQIGTVGAPGLVQIYGTEPEAGGDVFVYAKDPLEPTYPDDMFIFGKVRRVANDPTASDLESGDLTINTGTGQITIPTADVGLMGAWNLYAVTGDYAIESGLSVRCFRNVADHTTKSENDLTSTGEFTGSSAFEVEIGLSGDVPLPVRPLGSATFTVEAAAGTFTGSLVENGLPAGDGAFVYSDKMDAIRLARKTSATFSITASTFIFELVHSYIVDAGLVVESKLSAGQSYVARTVGTDTIFDKVAGLLYTSVPVVQEVVADRQWETIDVPDPTVTLTHYRNLGAVSQSPRPRAPIGYESLRIGLAGASLTVLATHSSATGATVDGDLRKFENPELDISALAAVGDILVVTNNGVTTEHAITNLIPPGVNPGRVEVNSDVAASATLLTYSIQPDPVLQATGTVGVDPHTSLVFVATVDVAATMMYGLKTLTSSEYGFIRATGGVSLTNPVQEGDRIKAAYLSSTVAKDAWATAKIYRELTTAPAGERTATYNTLGREVDTTVTHVVTRLGRQPDADQYTVVGNVVTFLDRDTTAGEAGATYVDYGVLDAPAGTKAFEIRTLPIDDQAVVITAGESTFAMLGDFTSQFVADKVMMVDTDTYIVSGSALAAGVTTVTIASTTFRRGYKRFSLLLSSGAVASGYTTAAVTNFLPVPMGSNLLVATTATTREIQPGTVVIATKGAVKHNFVVLASVANENVLDVTLSGPAPVTLDATWSVVRTTLPVVAASEVNFALARNIITGQAVTVWKHVAGVGPVDNDIITAFKLADSGQLTLDAPIGAGNKISVSYIASDPLPAGGSLRVTYVRLIDPAAEGMTGQTLKGEFTYHAPDTWFFRVEPMVTVLNEVKAKLGDVSSLVPSSGVVIPTTTVANYGFGSTGLIWERGDLIDQDFVAQAFLNFVNDVTIQVDDVLTNVVGDVIGDVDGYLRPAFDIDSTMLVSLTPYNVVAVGAPANPDAVKTETVGGFRIDYLGTTKSVWDTVYSRFFPTTFTASGLTLPAAGGYNGDDVVFDLGIPNANRCKITRLPAIARVTEAALAGVDTFAANNPPDDSSKPHRQVAAGSVIRILRVDGTVLADGLLVASVTTSSITIETEVIAAGSDDHLLLASLGYVTPPSDPAVVNYPAITGNIEVGDTVVSVEFARNQGTNFDVNDDGEVVHSVASFPTGVPGLYVDAPGIDPSTLVEAKFSVATASEPPHRVAALDGGSLNDQGGLYVPRIQPAPPLTSTPPIASKYSERSILTLYESAIQTLQTDTEDDHTGTSGTVVSAVTLDSTGAGTAAEEGDLVVIPAAANGGASGIAMVRDTFGADLVYTGMEVAGAAIDYEVDYQAGIDGTITNATTFTLNENLAVTAWTAGDYLWVPEPHAKAGVFFIIAIDGVADTVTIDAGTPLDTAGDNDDIPWRYVSRGSGATTTVDTLTDLGAIDFSSVPAGAKFVIDEGVVSNKNGCWTVSSTTADDLVTSPLPTGAGRDFFISRGTPAPDTDHSVIVTDFRTFTQAGDHTSLYVPGNQVWSFRGSNYGRYWVRSSSHAGGTTTVVVEGIVYPGISSDQPFRYVDSTGGTTTHMKVRRPRRGNQYLSSVNVVSQGFTEVGSITPMTSAAALLQSTHTIRTRRFIGSECSINAAQITDTSQDFVTSGVAQGDLVVMYTGGGQTSVGEVDLVVDANNLTLVVDPDLGIRSRLRYKIDNLTPAHQLSALNTAITNATTQIATGAGTVTNATTFNTGVDITSVVVGDIIITSGNDNQNILVITDVDSGAGDITVTASPGFYLTGAVPTFTIRRLRSMFGADIGILVETDWNDVYRFNEWNDTYLSDLDYAGVGLDILNPDDVTKSDISDVLLASRLVDVQARLTRTDLVGGDPSPIEDDLSAVTTNGTNLYNMRYVWLDARLNRRTGTLQKVRQFDLTRATRELETLNAIMKAQAMEGV